MDFTFLWIFAAMALVFVADLIWEWFNKPKGF